MRLFNKIQKRIRKETLSNGKVKYYCERTGVIRSNKWRVMTYLTGCVVSEDSIKEKAIFDTLHEAEKFMGWDSAKEISVINSEIIVSR